MNSEMRVPRFFIDPDDGMGCQLFGDMNDIELAARNGRAYLQVALEDLLAGEDGSQIILVVKRKDMADEEVDALPEE